MKAHSKTILALACMLPVPTLGTYIGMVALGGTRTGQVLFFLAKLWVIAVPIWWGLRTEPGALRRALCNWRGVPLAATMGAAVAAVIGLAYLLLGARVLAVDHMRRMADYVGLTSPRIYLAGSVYWVLLNALLEEVVYRWFLLSAFQRLGLQRWAVPAGATAFVLHHTIALTVYCPPAGAVLTSMGVFVGGLMWGWLFRRFASIPAVTVSHIIVDISVFLLGYALIFGA